VLSTIVPTKSSKKRLNLEDGSLLTSDELNNHFVDEPISLIEKHIINNFDSELPQTQLLTDKIFTMPPIEESDLRKTINLISTNKDIGPHGIPVWFLKRFQCILIPILMLIINTSFTTGIFLTTWKISRVTALYKNGNRNSADNYRPFNILSLFNKLIERHVNTKLIEHLTENKLLSNFQFRFRKNHSTIDALDSIQFKVYQTLNSKIKCALVSLDLFRQ
jgi:hypothetical protein